MAVFLFVVICGMALALRSGAMGGDGSPYESVGVLGGPDESFYSDEDVSVVLESQPVLLLSVVGSGSAGLIAGGIGAEEEFVEIYPGAIGDPGQPVGPDSGGSVILYNVQSGDTLSGIAAYFGVSLDTIVNANPGVRARFINPGDELNILPTSGVVYTTNSGDTLESVAAYFGVSESKVIQFNKGVDFGKLGVGTTIVVPGATSFRLAQSRSGSVPNFENQFAKPAEGFNWGRLHNHNAVDIANSCGTQVRAAAEGLVVPDESFGDGLGRWNGGYGTFVLIEHPFGTSVRTRYAHLSTALVSIGDYVKQGEQIGTIGKTGDSTGCHLHFEVYGAANPLAR